MAGERHRVHECAAVVHRNVIEEANLAGPQVDLNDRHMTHVSHDRIEDAEVGAVVRRQRRERMIVGVGGIHATCQRRIVGHGQPKEMGMHRDLGDGLLQPSRTPPAHLALLPLYPVPAPNLTLAGLASSRRPATRNSSSLMMPAAPTSAPATITV